jgi:hypothetical protein
MFKDKLLNVKNQQISLTGNFNAVKCCKNKIFTKYPIYESRKMHYALLIDVKQSHHTY